MKIITGRMSRRRGAILSMELVMIMPLFLVLIFSIVEFSMLMSASSRVSNAAQSGARLMSISGAAPEEVKAKVTAILGPALSQNCRIDVHPAAHVGDVGSVYVTVPMKNASPDLLWMTGFSLDSRSLNAESPMVMERCAYQEDSQKL